MEDQKSPLRNITSHFTWDEAMCKDETYVPEYYQANAGLVSANLETIRRAIGNKPMRVHSWFRTEKYNKEIGGAPKSQHLTASACDFSVEGMTPRELYMIIDALSNVGVLRDGGLGLYNAFVHYDIRGHKVRWDLRTKAVGSGE